MFGYAVGATTGERTRRNLPSEERRNAPGAVVAKEEFIKFPLSRLRLGSSLEPWKKFKDIGMPQEATAVRSVQVAGLGPEVRVSSTWSKRIGLVTGFGRRELSNGAP